MMLILVNAVFFSANETKSSQCSVDVVDGLHGNAVFRQLFL